MIGMFLKWREPPHYGVITQKGTPTRLPNMGHRALPFDKSQIGPPENGEFDTPRVISSFFFFRML